MTAPAALAAERSVGGTWGGLANATRRLAVGALLVGGTITLGSCYDFDAPIDPTPKEALDLALVGTWRCLAVNERPDAKPANFVVGLARDMVYSIRFDEGKGNPDLYEGHPSKVKGHTVLNVRDLDPRFPTKPWTFARYTFLLPNVLRVQLVNDEVLKGVEHTPTSLRAAFERLDGQADIYVDFCVCVRAIVAQEQGATSTPSNNEMQRTKPAQGMELRPCISVLGGRFEAEQETRSLCRTQY